MTLSTQFLQLLQQSETGTECFHKQKKKKRQGQTENSAIPSDLVRTVHLCVIWMPVILAAEAPCMVFIRAKIHYTKILRNDTYHLIVHQSQHTISEFNQCNQPDLFLSETDRNIRQVLQAFYEEHFQKIIRGNALQQLGKIS